MGIRFQDGSLYVSNHTRRDYLRIQDRHTRLRTFAHIFALAAAVIGISVMLVWPTIPLHQGTQVSASPIYVNGVARVPR